MQRGSEEGVLVSSQRKTWRTWPAGKAPRTDKACKGEEYPAAVVILLCDEALYSVTADDDKDLLFLPVPR